MARAGDLLQTAEVLIVPRGPCYRGCGGKDVMSEENNDTKPCPVCGETIKAVAIKCRFCNTDLKSYAQEQKAEVEETIFQGHPAVICTATQWAPVPIVIGLVVLASLAGVAGLPIAAGALVILGVTFAVYWIRSLARTFYITTQRISVERGVLSKVRNSLELFRIDHLELHKPIGMRLTGHCALHLFTSDQELTEFYLYGIANLEAISERLRECQLHERTRRGLTTFVKA